MVALFIANKLEQYLVTSNSNTKGPHRSFKMSRMSSKRFKAMFVPFATLFIANKLVQYLLTSNSNPKGLHRSLKKEGKKRNR